MNCNDEFELVRAVVVGAGSSSSTPMLRCALGSQPCPACLDAMADPSSRNHRLNPSFLLQLRRRTKQPPPQEQPQVPQGEGRRRRAPTHATADTVVNILIDCGKTFRESALKVFAPLHVRDLHAVLITHAHADAVLGLDDLREFSTPSHPVSVYTDVETQAYLKNVYSYLFPPPPTQPSPSEPTAPKLWVASVDWKTYHDGEPRPSNTLQRSILEVAMPSPSRPTLSADQQAAMAAEARRRAALCLPPAPAQLHRAATDLRAVDAMPWPIGVFHVWHGPNVASNSYVIPLPQSTPEDSSDGAGGGSAAHSTDCAVLLYISDVSECTAETLRVVRATIGCLHQRLRRYRTSPDGGAADATPSTNADNDERTDEAFLRAYVRVLVLDMLGEAPYPSHLSVSAAVDAATRIGAAQTFFVGMSHSLLYEAMPSRIEALGGDPSTMQLAWDGCVVFEGGGEREDGPV